MINSLNIIDEVELTLHLKSQKETELLEESVKYLHQNQLDKAETSLGILLQSNPTHAHALYNLSYIQHCQGNNQPALEAIDQCLRLNPNNANAHNIKGSILLQLQHIKDAIKTLEHAIRIQPNNTDILHNLSFAYMQNSRFKEALLLVQKRLKQNPANHAALNLMGSIYIKTQQYEQAIRCYEKILKKDPYHINATENLVIAYIHKGQSPKALSLLLHYLKKNPNRISLYSKLVMLKTFNKNNEEDMALVEWLQKTLARKDLTREEQINLHFCVAKIHKDQKNYEKAFGYYEKANRLNAPLMASYESEYSLDNDSFRQSVDQAQHESISPIKNTLKPLLIVGMPRSGSTLLEHLCLTDNAITSAGESNALLVALREGLPEQTRYRDYEKVFLALDNKTQQKIMNRYLTLLKKQKKTSRIIDKNLFHFKRLPILLKAFDHIDVIHTLRHPLDTCLSIYFQQFTHNQALYFSTDLEKIAHYYLQYREMIVQIEAAFPGQLQAVYYENLVEYKADYIQKIFHILNIKWSKECLLFYQTPNISCTSSALQIRKPLNADSLYNWVHYEAYIGPLRSILEKEIDAYETALQHDKTRI